MTEAEKDRFEQVVHEFLVSERRSGNNIGTFNEKSLHAILKSYIEEDRALHEIKIGKYVADVFHGNEIVEIQTGSFYPMVDKLRYYLEETRFDISVIRPIMYQKWCNWIGTESSGIISRRKSPKKATPISVMRDWLFLSDLIGNERLKIRFFLIEAEEFRFLDGRGRDKKRGSSRHEIIPTRIIDEEIYEKPSDYLKFIPSSLGDSFLAADFVKANKVTPICGNAALKLLCNIGLLRREKQGRAYIYYLK